MSRALSLLAGVFVFGLLAMPLSAQEHGAKIVDDAWVKAVNAGDVEALVALYAPDAVIYPPDAMEARGTAAIRAMYTGMLSDSTISNVSIKAAYQTVGELSIGFGTATMTMTPKAGGAPETMTVRVTAAVKKINGKWLYTVDHASVPAGPPPADAAKPAGR
jgi:uncharacterized protein (TIGR02246 family)